MLNFYDCYELINQYYYFNETIKPKVYIPIKQKPRVCIFCGKSDSETPFRKKAHIIPKALGNRTLFTTIECDECNQKSGDTIENDFIEYLNATRALAKKRGGDKGHVKYKPSGKISYIKSGVTSNTIEIYEDEADESIKVLYLPNNKMSIEMTSSRPINYVNVVKALAKMGLLLFTVEEIKANYHIIQWIKGEIDYLPIFLKGFFLGNEVENTILSVYKLKSEIPELEPIFVSFYFSNKFFFIHLPTKDFHLSKRRLVPAKNLSPLKPYKLISNIPPMITEITCNENKPTFKKEIFFFEYEKKVGPIEIIENKYTYEP